MAAPNYGNRLGRQARVNPGRRHLAGADVTAQMQRQYEHILASLRADRRYRSDAKRKQVAAATVRKMAKNAGTLRTLAHHLGLGDESRAERLSHDFHGRGPLEILDVTEEEEYDEHGAILGYLEELCILNEDDEDSVTPISFAVNHEHSEDNVLLVSNVAGTNLEFVGGDQDVDWQAVDGASEADKYLVAMGPVYSVAYWTDKHHLSGPKSQAQGTSYEHTFGEEGGELPYLIFDRRNKRLLLVGGEYTIEPEGITG